MRAIPPLPPADRRLIDGYPEAHRAGVRAVARRALLGAAGGLLGMTGLIVLGAVTRWVDATLGFTSGTAGFVLIVATIGAVFGAVFFAPDPPDDDWPAGPPPVAGE